MERLVSKRLGKYKLPTKKKVAAYCRVSIDKDAMLHSLANQTSYYQELILSNKDWLFAGIYADEGISGTKENRPEFNRMIEDCKAHKIDMIITKSISRFARNTTYLLETVRLLKSLNIDVYFEEQKMHSLSSDGELMLTLLASFAEEEAISMSNNVRWKVQKCFEQGKVFGIHDFYGYKAVDGNYVINEDEAKVIRDIFHWYVDEGIGIALITCRLREQNIPSPKGCKWNTSTIRGILKNITYTGNLMLGKCSLGMNESHSRRNNGKYPMYKVEFNHEAIIPLDIFEEAQRIAKERRELFIPKESNNYSPFAGKIKCASCGGNYVRKKNKYRTYWVCCSAVSVNGRECNQTLSLREDTLLELACKAVDLKSFDEAIFDKKVEKIIVHPSRDVDFVFKDGLTKTLHFEFRSRRLSWNDEMKEEARRRSLEKWKER